MARLRKFFSRFTHYEITKRQKLVFMTFVLTFFLIITQVVDESMRFQTVVFLTLATIGLSIFALWGELSGIKYLLLLLLPVYFVAGGLLFFFFFSLIWFVGPAFFLSLGLFGFILFFSSS